MSSGLYWERFGVITGGDEVCILPPPILSEKGVGIPTCVHFPNKKVWQRPPPRALLVRRKKKKKINKKNHASHPHVCLGATQVGVTQVVSVRLASVQGFSEIKEKKEEKKM